MVEEGLQLLINQFDRRFNRMDFADCVIEPGLRCRMIRNASCCDYARYPSAYEFP
jgi:hypothetical protein